MFSALILAASFANLPLSIAESSALANSPDVTVAAEHVNETKALLAAARGAFGPALTANYTQSPQAGANGQTISQHFTTLGAQMTIGDLINYSPAVAQAAANVRSAEFDLAAARRTENVHLIGLYYDALRAVATAQTRAEALRAAEDARRAAQIRFKAGDAPHLDVVRAEVIVARSTADLETAKSVQANALEALAIETGKSAPAIGPVVETSAEEAVPLPASADSAVRIALVRRPEIASAQSAVDAEAAAVRGAERAILPALIVSGGYTQGIDSGVAVRGPSANAQLTFPISNGPASRATAERARLAQAQARLALQKRQVTVEVAAAMRTYEADGRALIAAQEARRHAEAELGAVTVGYRSGASSSLEVTAARQTYVQAVLDELTARYAHAQARATLELLIGK